MKIKFRFLLVLLATFCATLVCGLVAACTETEDYGDPAKDGYIITVLYPDGSPVTNTDGDNWYDKPSVELTDENGTRIAVAQINASGVAYINYLVPGEYYIKLTDYPSGYAFDNKSVKTSANKARYTVSLRIGDPTPYVVHLEYPDEKPMDGVTVKLMNGDTNVATAVTNSEGVAITDTIERGVYSVVLENLPAGYDYMPVSTTIAAWPLYITTVGATDIWFEDDFKLDEEGIKPWDNALNDYLLGLKRFDKDGDCYAYLAEFEADEEVFFRLHAPKDGAYTIGSKAGNDYVIQFYNNNLTYVDSSLTISSETNNGNNIQRIQLKKDEVLSFSVKSQSKAAGTVEILVCLPVPTPVITEATQLDKDTQSAEFTLTFDSLNTAILRFITSKSNNGFGQGIYVFTSDSPQLDLMIVEYSNGYPGIDDNSDLTGEYKGFAGDDNSAGDGRNFLYTKTLEYEYCGGTYDYHVIIKDTNVTLPTQIKVKIKRTGDAITKEVERKVASTTVNTKYAEQHGTFTWMPTDGSIKPYRKDDGKWYVNLGTTQNPNEKALVVAITKELKGQEYSFATIEYLADGKTHDERVNTNLTVYEDLTTLDTTWNYTGFIEQYAQYKNSDGVYEVNDELKLFLERYMNQNFSNVTGSLTAPESPWLLGCGYYA